MIAPSALSFKDGDYPNPRAMTLQDIETVKQGFIDATERYAWAVSISYRSMLMYEQVQEDRVRLYRDSRCTW